ncbi:hypothetical protein BH11ARM1_BH11ARM1_03000 [soil metagenome]
MFCLLVALPLLQSAGWVWIEAENPSATNFPAAEKNPFAPQNAQEASTLSGGKWIGVEGKRDKAFFAEYKFDAPKASEYQMYARKFWKHGPYRWQIDGKSWHSVGADVALMDDSFMRKFTGTNWTYGGDETLAKGAHTLRVETTEMDGAAAFDAFIITSEPFVARGKLKPGEKYGKSDPGFFPFEPDPDVFKPSAIDLRFLNEKQAGELGNLQVKGDKIIHSKNGEAVKFWALNTGTDTLAFDHATMRNMARQWAKGGVNLVRIHGAPWGDDFKTVRPEYIDGLQYFVKALKDEGIYTCLSIYFPVWVHPPFDHSPFQGYTGRNPFDLIYFDPTLQTMYRSWWKQILTAPNKYSGMPLAQDPALAILECVNEESHFFWTFLPYNNMPAEQMPAFEKLFGSWVAKKYGSIQTALDTWKGDKVKGDDAAAGRVGFMELWQMFSSKSQRGQDTAQFLAENQREFYSSTIDYLKKDLGSKALVYGSNWQTAEPRILGPLDKWSNLVGDIMDRHGYFDLGHSGERAGYSISDGDKYSDLSALTFPVAKKGDPINFSLPIFDITYDNKPSTITEINWTPPNAYRADFPLVAAAYGSLQGSDAFYFFATGSPWWEETLGKFGVHTPVTFGQFPAAAYIFRKGLVLEAPPVVQANLEVSKLFKLEGAPLSAPVNLDQFRKQDVTGTPAMKGLDTIDPRSFMVGRVEFNFMKGTGSSGGIDMTPFIDTKNQTVKSVTKQLSWNYGDGLVQISAPMAQGITGYLSKAAAVDLGAIKISSPLTYGAIVAVSLDGKPLEKSSKILLQAMSQEQNFGWKTSGTGEKTIVSTGSAPMTVKDIAGTVTFKRTDAAKLTVTALDFNGYPVKRVGTAASIQLLPSTIYYLIEAKKP